MKNIYFFAVAVSITVLLMTSSCIRDASGDDSDTITLETETFSLELGGDALVRSLVIKKTGNEYELMLVNEYKGPDRYQRGRQCLFSLSLKNVLSTTKSNLNIRIPEPLILLTV